MDGEEEFDRIAASLDRYNRLGPDETEPDEYAAVLRRYEELRRAGFGPQPHHLGPGPPGGAADPTAWRPIETAPKDGTCVLLGSAYVLEIGAWNDDRHNKNPRPFWSYRGWRWTACRRSPPTHWMPLPEKPTAARPTTPRRTT